MIMSRNLLLLWVSVPTILVFITACGGGGDGGGDAQTPGISLLQTDSLTQVTEGGATDSFTLTLDARPKSNVTINFAVDQQTSVFPASVIFTPDNFSNSQTVTVSAVDDDLIEGTHGSLISYSVSSSDAAYDGYSLADLDVNVLDDDAAAVMIVESGGVTEITENGATDSYDVVLAAQPTATVNVNIATDPQASANTATLVFSPSNWNSPQTVILSAVDDTDAEGIHSSGVMHSVTSTDTNFNGITIPNVTANVVDDDVNVTVEFAHTDSSRTENEGIVNVQLRLILPPSVFVSISSPVRVDVSVKVSSTAGPDDYSVPASVTIPVGSTRNSLHNLSVTLSNDVVPEALEVLDISIDNVSGINAQPGSRLKHRMAIYDDDTGNLFATDSQGYGGFFATRLLSVDPASGSTVRASGWGPKGFKVTSMDIDSSTGRLYSVIRSELVVFDLKTGEGAPLTTTVNGMVVAFDETTGTLYGSDQSSLYRIDTVTGMVTEVGVFGGGYTDVVALAYDPNNSVLYGTDVIDSEIITINTATGSATSVGAQGIGNINSLAYDENNDILYGISTSNENLYTFNVATGLGTSVASTPVGFTTAFGLAYDAANDILYGADISKEAFYIIDTLSGTADLHKVNTFNKSSGLRMDGLTYDVNHNVSYGVHADAAGNPYLLQIQSSIGTARMLAPITGIAGTITDLAYDSDSDTLFAVASGNLYTLNVVSGVAGLVDSTLADPVGLAYDANSGTLFATDGTTNELISLNVLSASSTPIGPIGFSSVEGLAYDPVGGVLYGINTDVAGKNPVIITIDPATGAGTPLPNGVLFEDMRTGLMFDSNANKLFALNYLGLLDVDTVSGIGSSVGQLGAGEFPGLAYDRNTGTMYGVVYDSDDNKLVKVNPGNGTVTPIAGIAGAQIDGLAYDPGANVLYGVSMLSKEVLTINVSTGVVTPVGTSDQNQLGGGLAYDSINDRLYGIGINVLSNAFLVEFDLAASAATASTVPVADKLSGLAFDASTNTLFGINSTTHGLVSVNVNTGALNDIGPMAYPGALGLTWRD